MRGLLIQSAARFNQLKHPMKNIRISLLALAIAISGFPTHAAEQDAAATDLEKLQGEWGMISGLADGQAVPQDMLLSSSRVCTGSETTVMINGQLIMRAKFKLDPSKSPKNIDYEVLEGPAKGANMRGIYELEGDTVKFCFAPPGGERPSRFESQLGEQRTFSVWKKKKKSAPAAAAPAAPSPGAPAPAKPAQR
jgi:uncharacterized protein (TIGR03067 family)